MRPLLGLPALLLCVVVAGHAGACAARDDIASAESDILNGVRADGYEEAVLIDKFESGAWRTHCSGAVIAPTVVLTAGHCVGSPLTGEEVAGDWQVRVRAGVVDAGPVESRSFHAARAIALGRDGGERDIGLMFLDTPVRLTKWPVLATRSVDQGTPAIALGRMSSNGSDWGFVNVSPPFDVGVPSALAPNEYALGAHCASATAYAARVHVIVEGDSGGPVFVSRGGVREVVAVNSATVYRGREFLLDCFARVDVGADWIAKQIASHGGAALASADAGGSGQENDASK